MPWDSAFKQLKIMRQLEQHMLFMRNPEIFIVIFKDSSCIKHYFLRMVVCLTLFIVAREAQSPEIINLGACFLKFLHS